MRRLILSSMHLPLILLGALGCAASAAALGSPDATSAGRPNVVLILTDDQGFGDFGSQGNSSIVTPTLDALARESMVFDRFYVSAVCSPTRASLLTGRYNYRTRVTQTARGLALMEPAELTLAEALGAAGYATGIFGKWHLGDEAPLRSVDQGFEESLVHRGAVLSESNAVGAYTDPTLVHNGLDVQTKGYCTDVFFGAGIEWMRKVHGDERPFFLYLPTNVPHLPVGDAPAGLRAEYRAALEALEPSEDNPRTDEELDLLASLYAMLTNVDENVGRLLETLRELEIEDDTIVIFLSDNGPSGRIPRFLAGLRGAKGTPLEGGLRTPCFVRWPARLGSGHVEQLAAHIDLMPTLLAACAVDVPEGIALDGRSLLPLLTGAESDWDERMLFFQHHRGSRPVRYRNVAVLTQRWKLINALRTYEELELPPRYALYDLESDPGETIDRAAKEPEVVAALAAAYETWFDDVSHTRPDNFAPPAIHVGARDAQTVRLDDQDRQREPSRWFIRVVEPGELMVEAVVPMRHRRGRGKAVLRIGDETWEQRLMKGASEVRFVGVEPDLGAAHLTLVFTSREKSHPALAVRVSPVVDR